MSSRKTFGVRIYGVKVDPRTKRPLERPRLLGSESVQAKTISQARTTLRDLLRKRRQGVLSINHTGQTSMVAYVEV